MEKEHKSLNRPDLNQSRIKKDEADIQSLMQLMEASWLNPFKPENEDLVSLSSATAAPPDIEKDLLDANKLGKESYQVFRQERVEADVPSKKFHDKMTKMRLKTFSDIRKKPHTQGHAKDVVLKADRDLFGHMILVAESRKLHMADILAHPLGPLPFALASGDGTLCKTNKASLARELEKNVAPAEILPSPSATVIDGMSLLQKLKGSNKTFSQLAESVMTHVLQEGAQSHRIDVVFDVYEGTSIKMQKGLTGNQK